MPHGNTRRAPDGPLGPMGRPSRGGRTLASGFFLAVALIWNICVSSSKPGNAPTPTARAAVVHRGTNRQVTAKNCLQFIHTYTRLHFNMRARHSRVGSVDKQGTDRPAKNKCSKKSNNAFFARTRNQYLTGNWNRATAARNALLQVQGLSACLAEALRFVSSIGYGKYGRCTS